MKYTILGLGILLTAVLGWKLLGAKTPTVSSDTASTPLAKTPLHDNETGPSRRARRAKSRLELAAAKLGLDTTVPPPSRYSPGDLASTPETVGGLQLPALADGTPSPFAMLSVAEAEAFTYGYLLYTQELKDLTGRFEENTLDYPEFMTLLKEMDARTGAELRELLGPERSSEFTQSIGTYFAKIGPEEVSRVTEEMVRNSSILQATRDLNNQPEPPELEVAPEEAL